MAPSTAAEGGCLQATKVVHNTTSCCWGRPHGGPAVLLTARRAATQLFAAASCEHNPRASQLCLHRCLQTNWLAARGVAYMLLSDQSPLGPPAQPPHLPTYCLTRATHLAITASLQHTHIAHKAAIVTHVAVGVTHDHPHPHTQAPAHPQGGVAAASLLLQPLSAPMP